MNHRMRDKSSRSLLSQFDTQPNDHSCSNSNSNNSITSNNLIRKFCSSTTSTTTKNELSTTASTTTTTVETLSNEKFEKQEFKLNSNVQFKSASKIKNFTKNLLSSSSSSSPASTSTKDIKSTIELNKKVTPINVTNRPNTLNVLTHEQQLIEVKLIIVEALNAWRSKARYNVVPAERLKELFNELQFNPSSKQISEILQTAKIFTRKAERHINGLTFGEFCVLAADLKRFRSCNFSSPPSSPSLDVTGTTSTKNSNITATSDSNLENVLKSHTNSPEVFLGGSCNPTTWRADVAIPTLDKLGISFYNPQVSHWTPDLIELEYRAKEKAQVLFFVMDSETRASAGAIEVAYIAGQNARQLVLVLHSYRPEQCINNEPISVQEYTDLIRNQQLLKELVQRRGIPVLDNISEGLKRTKQILAGVRDPPTSISSILIIIRGAFDRVLSSTNLTTTSKTTKSNTTYPNNINSKISLEQCQLALSFLGYAQSFLTLENLKNILLSYKEPLQLNGIISPTQQNPQELQQEIKTQSSPFKRNKKSKDIFNLKNNTYNDIYLSFDEFCIVAAHLSLLQQEIYEHGCISPIKGTNITPPPIFLANMQETSSTENVILRTSSLNNSKRILRTGSFNISSIISPSPQLLPLTTTAVTIAPTVIEEKLLITNERNNSRDSGTSSPQPPLIQESGTQSTLNSNSSTSCSSCSGSGTAIPLSSKNKYGFGHRVRSSRSSGNFDQINASNQNSNYDSALEDESDSNDSVFSSGSSVNSYLCETKSSFSSVIGKEFCDVYLGGSCFLRTTWRYKIAIPYLNSKGITYHLPALHESIIPSQKLRRWLSEISSKSDEDIPSTSYDEKLLINLNYYRNLNNNDDESSWPNVIRKNLYNPSLLDSSRILLFVITNETRSLAPMTLAAHCIGLMYNIVLCVQMLPENDCVIGNEKLTAAAIKDYNRGRSYLVDLAKRQGVPVFNDIKEALDCVVEKLKASYSRNNVLQNKFLRIL